MLAYNSRLKNAISMVSKKQDYEDLWIKVS